MNLRKALTLISLSIASAMVLTACAGNTKATGNGQPANNKKEMKTLVAYFSASGVTEGVAKRLAEAAGADLYQITPAQPYTDADLDWTDKQSRSTLEMQDKSSRPAIAEPKADVAAYDVIYVGFPIWWYTAPTIINTWIESLDLKGKTVIPFATSGGSTIDRACAELEEAYPDINWKEGRLLNNPSEQELKEWVESNR